MEIGIVFEQNNILYQLPVNPAELSIKQDSDNMDVNVIDLGQVTNIGVPKLRTLEISSFFPNVADYPFVQTNSNDSIHGFKAPEQYIEFFKGIQSSKKPCRMVVTELDINMLVTIESFEYTFMGGTDDKSYKMTLREFRPHTERVVTVVKPVTSNPTSGNTTTVTPKPTTTTFAVGDKVTVNGTFRYTSYGAKPHGRAVNVKGVIQRIIPKPKSGQNYPIHIVNSKGGWLGWVKKSEIKKA